jgi:hypothetical protein
MSHLPTSYVNRRAAGRTHGVIHEHVLIAERALGKPLPSGAQVHHVDENRRNNANRNLVICQNQSYHLLLHSRAHVLRAGGNPNTDFLCSTCNVTKPRSEFNKRHSTLCRACQAAYFAAYTARKAAAL